MEGNESFEGNPATRLYIHTCALGNCLINMYMYLKVSISDDGPAKCPKNGLYTVHVHVASKCVTACTHTYMCTLYGSRASQFVQLKAASLAPLNATKTFLLKSKRIRDERTQGSRQLPLFEVHVHVHTAITDYNYKSRFQNFYRFTKSGSSQIEA